MSESEVESLIQFLCIPVNLLLFFSIISCVLRVPDS